MTLIKTQTTRGTTQRRRYDRTYYVIGLLAADDSLQTIHSCKTKATAVKYAQKALDTLLYHNVTIDCMVRYK